MTNEARSVPDLCPHPEFTSRVDVTRISEFEDGPITGYTADIVVRCARCNEPFDFIGLPVGSSPAQPMVSFDGIEARMPLRPHFGEAVPASPALPEPPVPWRSSHYPETCGECHHDASHDTKGGEGPPLCEEWDCDCRNFTPVPVEGDDSERVAAAREALWRAVAVWAQDGISPEDRAGFDCEAALAAHEAAVRADERRVAEERIAELEAQKDGAYSERNKTVIALAWVALRAGCRVGVREHEGDWDDDWRAILMIDLPTGQASWHFHDSERPLLSGFPAYPDAWDGHTTEEKYERMRALSKPTQEAHQ